MYRWGGIVLLVCCIAVAIWSKWLRPAPPVVSAIYLQIEALNAGEPVMLSIGISNHCSSGIFVNFAGCRLDKVAELSIGGKIVATIDAGLLTSAQQERLKEALQTLINHNNGIRQLQPIREAAKR